MRRADSPSLLRFATLAIMLVSLSSFAQQHKILAPHDHIAPQAKKHIDLPALAGSAVAGPWMIDANFQSTIYLKNIVETSAVTVTPVLYLSNGKKYQLPPVQLDPAGTADVDINAALQSLGIAPYATLSGWVELQYNWAWPPLCAMLRVTSASQSVIFTFGFETADQALPPVQASQAVPSQVIEGMWWKQEPGVTGFVSLANTTSQSINAVVQITDTRATVLGTHNITISPGGMKTVQLLDLPTTSGTAGGLRVSYRGQAGSLLINGGLQDPAVGYSANLRFAPRVRPAPPMSHPTAVEGISEVGLMTGAADPMMHFPAGTTFTPYSVLRNVSTGPISVSPTVWVMQGGAPASFNLPQFSLVSGETRSLDVQSMLASVGLKNFNGSFNLSFDTQGSLALLIAGGSVDQTNTYVFEVAARTMATSAGKSLSYWSTGNGDDTMVTIWNPADEAQNFTFRLTFAGGHYDLPIQLGARETRNFNISQIIETQVPDAEGNIIPANTWEGSAKLVGDRADNQNILVVMDSGVYNVRKATCGGSCQSCDGGTTWTVLQDPLGLDVGYSNQQTLTAHFCSGYQYDETYDSNWSTDNTSVATVQTGMTTGVQVGSFNVMASDPHGPICFTQCNPYGSCSANSGGGGSAPGKVSFCPTSLSVLSTTAESLNALFPKGDRTGVGAMTKIQALPSNKTWDGATLTEVVAAVSSTCPSSWPANAVSLCQGSSSFPVGENGQTHQSLDGQLFPAQSNVFLDEHVNYSKASFFDAYGSGGSNTCQIVCRQQYVCGGTVRGTFTITYNYSKGTLNGQPVTNVSVTKQ